MARNTTHGSRLFKSSLPGKRLDGFLNTTHGSGWIVQVQPTKKAARRLLEYHPRKWVDRSSPAYNGPHLGFPVCSPSPSEGEKRETKRRLAVSPRWVVFKENVEHLF